MDGYKFTEREEAGRGLGISTVASFGGGIISGIVLILVAPQLAGLPVKFNAPESFAWHFSD
ncbi:MAG: tripartite tricarboxylate transporter permease [Enterocloster clostridioformis]